MQVVPSNLDDLWELYNVVRKGDRLSGRSLREVKVETDAARPTKGRRVSIPLEIEVDNRNRDILLLQMDGLLTKEELSKALDMAEEASKKIHTVQEDALKKFYEVGEEELNL